MKTIKYLWIFLSPLYLILLPFNISIAQDCPNWGAASVISFSNNSQLVSQLNSGVDYKGVKFSFSLERTGESQIKCENGKYCSNYKIHLTITNNNNYRIIFSAGGFGFRPNNPQLPVTGGNWEFKNTLEPGQSMSNSSLECFQCGWSGIISNCWCGTEPAVAIFIASVTDLRSSDFENWRSSAENYYAWAKDKDTEPIEYRLCAKQHYLNALSYKEDKYCRDRIAEIDGFLKKINDENIAYNKKVDAYNQKIDEYNNLNKAINENINTGEYEKALESLGKLKTIAAVLSPEEAVATEERINELKKFIAEKSNKKIDTCPEGDKLINEYSTALNGYLTSLSKTLSGGSNSTDYLISSSQKITDITQRFSNLGCTLTAEQTARFDELMAKFANAAMEISEKGLDNVLKEVQKPVEETTRKGNFMPLIGTTSVDPLPKQEYRPSLTSKSMGGTLDGGKKPSEIRTTIKQK
jgi:hypothetical protein